jgi:predicted MFS family arabinose efflux permease
MARAAGPYAAARSDRVFLTAAAVFRSIAIGMTGVLLALHLNARGWDVRGTGLVIAFGLAGSAVGTLLVSYRADALGRRRTLLITGILYLVGTLGLLADAPLGPLCLLSFVGLLNGLGRDRGPAYALEQAILPQTTSPERRTLVLAWYSLALDVALALGSLAAGLPVLLRQRLGWETLSSYRAAWWVCLALFALSTLLYTWLSPQSEATLAAPTAGHAARFDAETRRRVRNLALLTGMDSFGGGFLTGALVSYWFFQRFGLSEALLGPLFFAARIANAVSHLVAAGLARRFGLLNTMVFTHIPSSLFLVAVPFAPNLTVAALLFLAREALVEMDVPTRQSYIVAVVPPEARSYASGVTTFTRNVAYATAPALAGLAMSSLSLSLPLLLGGGIKIAYDILLFASFRRIKPPEELAGATGAG